MRGRRGIDGEGGQRPGIGRGAATQIGDVKCIVYRPQVLFGQCGVSSEDGMKVQDRMLSILSLNTMSPSTIALA